MDPQKQKCFRLCKMFLRNGGPNRDYSELRPILTVQTKNKNKTGFVLVGAVVVVFPENSFGFHGNISAFHVFVVAKLPRFVGGFNGIGPSCGIVCRVVFRRGNGVKHG